MCWSAVSAFVRAYPWNPKEEEYSVHLTSGSPYSSRNDEC
jgi:sigma54-dependent transcription regulator